jgi:DNA repair protein RadC
MEATDQNPQWAAAEIQLVYKTNVRVVDRPQIMSSRDAFTVLKAAWNNEAMELIEQFKVMYTDRANRVLAIYNISSGGITGTVVDPKLIFAAALKVPTSGIIMAHNHPAGTLTASDADIQLTRKLKECARLFDMQILDHIILTTEGYYSFADEGLI